MIKQPLVSVIMNCHNGELYLREAIDSVYSQTYSNWEIIFWDNCSTDNSAKIAQSYDHRLKYYQAEHKTVLGKARNLALANASGKYVSFLDCDDLLLSDKLQSQIKTIINDDNLGFMYGRCEIFFDQQKKENKIFKNNEILPSGWIFDKLIKDNFVPLLTAIIDKDKLIECGAFPDHYVHAEEYWVFLNLARKYKVEAQQSVCARYRIHENNLSNSQTIIGAKEAIDIVNSYLPEKAAMEGLKYQYINLAIAYFKEKKYLSFLQLLTKEGLWIRFIKRILKKLLLLLR